MLGARRWVVAHQGEAVRGLRRKAGGEMPRLVALPGFSTRGEVLVRAADLVAGVFLVMDIRLRPNPCSAKMQRCLCSFMVQSCGLIC